MAVSATPPPPTHHLLKKSRLRVSSIPSLTHHPWNILLLLSFISATISSSSSSDNLCTNVVPKPFHDGKNLPTISFYMQIGYFRLSGKFLGLDPQDPSSSSAYQQSTVEFFPSFLSETSTEGVLHLKGDLIFRTGDTYPLPFGRWHPPRIGPPLWKRNLGRGNWHFQLDGFWSESDGMLCMVGSGPGLLSTGNFSILNYVLRLTYTKNTTILSSLVTGTFESSDLGPNHFDTVSILGYRQQEHEYTLISQANSSCSGNKDEEKSLSFGSVTMICSILGNMLPGFELEYKKNCTAQNCNPLGMDSGFLPHFMGLKVRTCSDQGRLQFYLTFSNSSYDSRSVPFAPEMTLVGEGFWDEKEKQLCVVACRIMNFTNSLVDSVVGDCTIGMSLRFSASLSIRNMSLIVGDIWSGRSKTDSGYFDRIAFRSLDNNMRGLGIPGLMYEYTETDRLSKSCSFKKDTESSSKRYPDGTSYDMRFPISTRPGGPMVGRFSPLFIGNKYARNLFMVGSVKESAALSPNQTQKLWNVSYVIRFDSAPNAKWGEIPSTRYRGSHRWRDISAEGIYDTDTGRLCMVGCRYLSPNYKNLSEKFDRLDCEVSINVQFAPLNAKAEEYLNGKIRSTRGESDPLYFDPLEIYSRVPYREQSRKMIKRMDLEIIMVLISLTLACIFIGSQLFYMKRHPDVLPSVSLLMLIILTLGHMIPLVLNYEALFVRNHSKQNVLLRSGGWLEVNEIIVRVMTMIAFLLQFRLLQLTWSARLAETSEKGLSIAERKVAKWCLSIYLVGVLIAWLAHLMKSQGTIGSQAHHSLWGDLISYSGLVLDGFLLPQIIFNIVSNTRCKALAFSFYVGTTLVRALPHAYDTYRAHNYLPHFRRSYIYADPDRDFYSTAWDILIPCGGLVFAIIVLLQQRFGGGCIVPRRFRELAEYDKVPVIDG